MIKNQEVLEEPINFLEMRDRIVSRYPELSPQLQSIAQFALSDPETVALETVVQLAKRLNAPPSSIVRFAQAMGCSGFAEMKRGFSAHLVFLAKAQSQLLDTGEGKGPAQAVRSFVEIARQELDALERDLDVNAFDRAVEKLASADEIYVSAQHLSFAIGSRFAWSLIEAGRQCLLLDNVGGFALRQSELSKADDATLCISFSPYQPSVVQAAQAHFERGGTVVAVTDTPLSPLAPYATELLIVPGLKVLPNNSLAGAVCLIRALAEAVLVRTRKKKEKAGSRRGKSRKTL